MNPSSIPTVVVTISISVSLQPFAGKPQQEERSDLLPLGGLVSTEVLGTTRCKRPYETDLDVTNHLHTQFSFSLLPLFLFLPWSNLFGCGLASLKMSSYYSL